MDVGIKKIEQPIFLKINLTFIMTVVAAFEFNYEPNPFLKIFTTAQKFLVEL